MSTKGARNDAMLLAIASSVFVLNGCRAIGDIFKAGMWVGVVIAVLVVAVIGGIAAAFRRG